MAVWLSEKGVEWLGGMELGGLVVGWLGALWLGEWVIGFLVVWPIAG